MATNFFDDFMIWVPTQIFFGKTALEHLEEGVRRFKGSRVLLVYGGNSVKKNGVYDQVVSRLDDAGIFHCEVSGVQPNPRATKIDEGLKIARENKVDFVLAMGGGSVIDTAKAIAGAYHYDGNVMDFMDSLHGAPYEKDDVLPIGTVLTLPASGSEMATGNTFVNDYIPEHTKGGFHGPYVRPRVTFENPEFTYTLPRKQTCAGVSDVICHIIESYFSNQKGSYLHARTAEGMLKTLIKYAPIALAEPDNYEARANIMYTSSWGNNGYIVKGNYVSWSVHLLENPLNEQFNITHGEGLAVLTPHWLRWAKKPENLYRYVDFAVNVWGLDPTLPEEELAEKGIEALENFYYNVLGMPRTLRELGVDESGFEKAAAGLDSPGAVAYQSMAFVPMDSKAAMEIYKAAL